MIIGRALLLLLGLLLWAVPVQATTYWTETFENHLWTGSNGNPWDTGGCGFSAPDGCVPGPIISTDFAHPGTGTHSLKSVSPGTFFDRYFGANTTELWTRYYIYLSNFVANPDVGMKIQYYANPSTLRSYPNFYAHIFPGNSLGIVAQGVWQNGAFTTTNYPANAGSGTLANGQWYCIEEHLKMSSPGQANGVIEVWKDTTTQILNYPAVQLNGPNDINPVGCTILCNSSNTIMALVRHYDHEISQGARYIDDLAVGTTRIGCGGAPPPADSTPPNPVTGLAVSTAGAATWNATTDNTGGSGLASYTLLRCTGTCTPTVTLTTTGPSATSYSDLSVVAGTTYSYAIKATDNSGNSTAQSATVTMTAAGTTRTLLATYTPSGSGADLGASWDAGYTGKSACQLVSSTIEATTLNTDCMETYNGISTPNDQWEQIPLTAFTGTQVEVAAVLLRTANAPTVTGYLCVALKNGGQSPPTTTLIQKFDGVTNPILASETSTTWAATDALRCEVQGSTIKAIRVFGSSESVLLTANDTTYTAGKAGLLIFINTGGSLTDIKIGTVTIGGFAASAPPAIATVTNVSRTQATVTWDLTTLPTNIRAWTGDAPVGTVTAPLSSYPSGVYTYPPTILNKLTDYICFIAQDSGGNEIANSQKCAAVPAAPIDTAPPVVTLSAPTGTLPAGTTAATLAVTLDKFASCREDTTDQAGTDLAAFNLLANAMTTASLTASRGLTGLSAGTVNHYVRCDFVDTLSVDHPNPTSLTIPVTVAASTPDTVAPSDVTGNVAVVVSPTQVSASWNAATPHGIKTITGYQVALSYGAGNTTYVLVGLPVTATNIITDVLPGTVVNVVVKAIDSSNVISTNYSNISTVTTPAVTDNAVPSTMTGLRVERTFAGSVVVTADPCVNTSGPCTTIYEISPAGCAAFVFIYSRVTLEAQLDNLSANTSYCLRGKFSNGTNQSLAYSDIITFTTASAGLGVGRATLPFGTTRNSVSRSAAGTRAVRP